MQQPPRTSGERAKSLTPSGAAGQGSALRVLLVEPAARTSNEVDLFRAMPDTHLIVLSDRVGWEADDEIVLRSRRLPYLGRREGWTAAPAWLAGLRRLRIPAPDVIVSLELFSFGTWQAARLARRLGVPHAVWIAETLADNPLYRLPPWREISNSVVPRADLFVCMTDTARKHAIARGCDPGLCTVVNVGVDLQIFNPRPEGLVTRPIVLFVGMLRADRGANKGVREIVAACDQLASEVPDLELRLVGEGHLRHELEHLASTRPFLSVLPTRPRSEIPDIMRSARALVLASRRTWKWEEQFGFVLVEAMASGLPVVSTRCGATPEVVPAWNPLVEPGDVAGLAAGLREVLGPAGERLGARNQEEVRRRFDLHTQGRLLCKALASVERTAEGEVR